MTGECILDRRAAEALVEDTNTLIRDRTVEARQLAEGLPLLAVAWRASATSAAAAALALARMNRAWALGEAGFSDLALARRAAFEVDAAELGARLDMHAALLQVDIDTHTLWVTEPHGSDLSEGPPLER